MEGSDLVREMLHREADGVGAAWPSPQNEASAMAVLFEQRPVPVVGLHQLDRLFAATDVNGGPARFFGILTPMSFVPTPLVR